jgi:hypothetical protein
MCNNEHHMHIHTLMGCHITITTNVADSGDKRVSRRVSSPWLDVCKLFFILGLATRALRVYFLFYINWANVHYIDALQRTLHARTHLNGLPHHHHHHVANSGEERGSRRPWLDVCKGFILGLATLALRMPVNFLFYIYSVCSI